MKRGSDQLHACESLVRKPSVTRC